MRKVATALVVIALLAGIMTVHAADADYFDEGVKAYYRGDFATALPIFRKLADQGNALAQFNLGLMYDDGKGVAQDYKEAVKWYRKAADQGHAKAQSNLGTTYANGYGVTQDFVQAHMWWNIAAAQGYEHSRENRDTLAKRMTAAQIAEAQRLARQRKSKNK